MDKGKGSINNEWGESIDIDEIDDIDTSKTVDACRNIELENLIKKDILNIDTMREESEDGGPSDMDGKDQRQKSVKEKIIKFTKKILFNVKDAWNGYVELSGSNLIYPVVFLIGTIIYLEIVTHIMNYRSLDFKIIYPVLFSIPFGLLLGFITGLFKELINKILLWIFTIAICLVFAVQLVYFYIFQVYFSFQSIGMAGEAVSSFFSDIITAVKSNMIGLLLIFFPVIILALLIHKLDFTRRVLKIEVILAGSTILFHIVALVALLLFGREDYSPYDLYHKSKVMDLCGKELGITTMTRFDMGNIFGGNDDLALADAVSIQDNIAVTPTAIPKKIPATMDTVIKPKVTTTPAPTPINTSPNVLNIDFKSLANNTKNNTYKTLDHYFAAVTPTKKNKYTGMFKGYNLILITAEGFSRYAVNKEKTPTLYKLTHEGFVFNNFYTALWQTSTSDGEYCALTGLIPTEVRNMYKGRKNLWPFSLGNQFDKLGVASKAYHDNTYTYYERNETHPNLGYIFKAKGNGLKLEHPNYWPESDLEMINSTVDEYIGEDQFHVYYMTVSGHMNYTFTGNMMSYKNKDKVKDLPYSEDVKAYIASQIELDRALNKLIKKLEEAGVAEHTVIALSADHYPYAWKKSTIDEAAGHKVDPTFEMYKNKFILWSKGMKEKVQINEPCSSLDILPTLSNLFGLEYDSRFLMGRDVLSDAAPLVILANRSFITDKVMYNAQTAKVTRLTKDALAKDYISNLNKIVKNKFAVSKSILESDYYRHIFGDSN